jgi:aminopeptidase N
MRREGGAVLTSLALAMTLAAGAPEPPALRLPPAIVPLREDVELELDPAQPRYRGTARIDVDVSGAAPLVWLHARDLTVTEAVAERGGRRYVAQPVATDTGFVGLRFDRPLEPGPATLVLAFTGALDRTRSRGIYAVPENGAWYAYTFFEPVDARRAFPCFDEPAFKIPWRLGFRVPAGDGAWANAPIAERRRDGDREVLVTAWSKPMSTYQVAFVVGPFDVVEGGTAGRAGVRLRFLVPRGRGAETQYARRVTPRIVTALEEFFGSDYPYEKLDVAVPPRFWGTMEHPGIVALGQPLTLIRPGEETRERRRRYVNIAVHELAHYWLGDYVTMAWWDDTWLNEALTTWADARVTERIDPAWRFLTEALVRRRSAAIDADALPSAKAVRQPVRTAEDIQSSFEGNITYNKGSTVVAAFEQHLGVEPWRDVIRRFLAAHAWGNASTDDFVSALESAAGHEVARAFRGFVEQPGVPEVEAAPSCGGGPPRIALTQRRFLLAAPGVAASGRWTIPLCLRYGAGARTARACTLLASDRAEIGAEFCPEWIVPDQGAARYHVQRFRPQDLRAALAASDDLPGQLAALDDARLLARRGELPLEAVLPLVPVLANDPDRLRTEAALRLLSVLQPRFLDGPDRARYAAFVRRSFGRRARALGWLPRGGDDEDVRALRSALVPWVAIQGEDAGLRRAASALARKWLADHAAVPAEIVPDVLRAAAASGDRSLLRALLSVARDPPDATVRQQVVVALGAFRSPVLVRGAFAAVETGEIEARDAYPLVAAALTNPAARPVAWAWLRDAFPRLRARMRDDEASWLLRLTGSARCDPAGRADIEAAFGALAARIDGGPLALRNALDEVSACAAERQRLLPSIRRALAQPARRRAREP